MSMQPYLAGNTVYGSGSSAATTGTVDPLGYIQRELEKRRQQYQGGADGQSDTRSGLAANALENLSGNTGTSAAQVPTQQAAQQQFYSMIGASPTGALQYPQLDLPFDLDIANQRASDLAQFNQSSAEGVQGIQAAAQNRVNQQRSLDEQTPGMFRNLLNNFAGRGLARSSGYATGVADTSRDIFNSNADIEGTYQGALQGIANSGNQSRLSFLDRLNSLGSQQAERAASNAANLALTPASAAGPTPVAAPAPTAPLGYSGGMQGMQTSLGTGSMSKAAFLKAHPGLASTSGAARNQFLKNHPDIAKAWARYN